jgi:hypothetical protein
MLGGFVRIYFASSEHRVQMLSSIQAIYIAFLFPAWFVKMIRAFNWLAHAYCMHTGALFSSLQHGASRSS